MDGPDESVFLRGLFTRLEHAGVFYAVMRNYDGLPLTTGGSDLDILIEPADADQISAIVVDAAEAVGGAAIGIAKRADFIEIQALGAGGRPEGCGWGVKIDLMPGLSFRGIPYLTSFDALPTSVHNEIVVLDEGIACVIAVLKDVLHNAAVPMRYLSRAQSMAAGEWLVVEKVLEQLGHAALGKFRDVLAQGMAGASVSACAAVRSEFVRFALRKSFFATCYRRLRYEGSKFVRYLRPSGMMIAVLGVDGSGKSSVIGATRPILDAATHRSLVTYHLRPGLLPALAQLLSPGRGTRSSVVTEPHGLPASGRAVSLVRLLYLLADYVIGYWFIVRPKIAKQPTVVLFDRYAVDLMIDPRRFRIDLPKWLLRTAVCIVPKPHLYICLVGSPAVISRRKSELSLQETARQVAELKSFAKGEKRAMMVASDTCLHVTAHECLRSVVAAARRRGGDG